MSNPLIANCPEDPTLAAAYAKGAREMAKAITRLPWFSFADMFRLSTEIKDHVLRMIQRQPNAPESPQSAR